MRVISVEELFGLCNNRETTRITFSSRRMHDEMIGDVKRLEVTFNLMLHSKDWKNISFIGDGCRMVIQDVQSVILYDELFETGIVFDITAKGSNPQKNEYTFFLR